MFVLTTEELIMVRDYIIIPFMLEMIENDRRKIESDRQPLRTLYVQVNEALYERVNRELVRLKKELRAREIKVVENDRTEFVLNYTVYNNGYHGPFGITREVVKTEIAVQLGQYVRDLAEVMKGK